MNQKLVCPKCGNENIKKVGDYYQCQYDNKNPLNKSCGYINIIEKFIKYKGIDEY